MARKSKKQRVKQEEDVKEEAQEEDKDQEEPTDEVLRSHIKRLIPLVNLQNTGVKAFTKLLSKECGGADLKPRSKFIKQALSDAINAMDESESEDEDESESEDEKPEKKKKSNRIINEKRDFIRTCIIYGNIIIIRGGGPKHNTNKGSITYRNC